MIRKLLATDNDVIALVLRLTLGIVMFPHGAQKLLGWFGGSGFGGTMAAFTGMGMPAPLVFLIIMAESFGAVMLILGLAGRFAAFGIACVMTGAALMVHAQHGFFMNWFGQQKGEGFEYHLLALGIAIALMIRGSGALSLDQSLAKRLR
ncbi:MAG: DoxX family protein [Blastocatellia bacterium]